MANTDLTTAGAIQKYLLAKWQDMPNTELRTPVIDGDQTMPMNIPKNGGQFAELRWFDRLAITPTSATDSQPKTYAAGADLTGSDIQKLTAKVAHVPLSLFLGAAGVENLASSTDILDLSMKINEALKVHVKSTAEKFTLGSFVRGMDADNSLVGLNNVGGSAPSMTISAPFRTIFGGNASNYAGVTQNSFHSMDNFRRAAAWLSNKFVPKAYGGKFYVAYVSPAIKEILMRDPGFEDVVKRHPNLAEETKILGHLVDYAGIRFIETDFAYCSEPGDVANMITCNGVQVPKRVDTGIIHWATVLGAGAAAACNLGGETAKRIQIKVQDITTVGSVTTAGYKLPFQGGPVNRDRGVNIAAAVDPNDIVIPDPLA